MKVLHRIYAYKKGLRHLVLHTLDASFKLQAELKLQQQGIDYIRYVTSSKINLFFLDAMSGSSTQLAIKC